MKALSNGFSQIPEEQYNNFIIPPHGCVIVINCSYSVESYLGGVHDGSLARTYNTKPKEFIPCGKHPAYPKARYPVYENFQQALETTYRFTILHCDFYAFISIVGVEETLKKIQEGKFSTVIAAAYSGTDIHHRELPNEKVTTIFSSTVPFPTKEEMYRIKLAVQQTVTPAVNLSANSSRFLPIIPGTNSSSVADSASTSTNNFSQIPEEQYNNFIIPPHACVMIINCGTDADVYLYGYHDTTLAARFQRHRKEFIPCGKHPAYPTAKYPVYE
ncbi:MAG: hypothetical protein ACK4PR_07715, partial [Gammaproteobacteria bacterium]